MEEAFQIHGQELVTYLVLFFYYFYFLLLFFYLLVDWKSNNCRCMYAYLGKMMQKANHVENYPFLNW